MPSFFVHSWFKIGKAGQHHGLAVYAYRNRYNFCSGIACCMLLAHQANESRPLRGDFLTADFRERNEHLLKWVRGGWTASLSSCSFHNIRIEVKLKFPVASRCQ